MRRKLANDPVCEIMLATVPLDGRPKFRFARTLHAPSVLLRSAALKIEDWMKLPY